jgi:hypothetical protein
VSGAPDPAYVAARRVLLDVLDALGEQRAAIVLVGAQAIYVRTGEGDFAVAPYTLDADLALEPAALKRLPDLTGLLEGAGFTHTKDIGIWSKAVEVNGQPGQVTVDFLVPERLGGEGRRAARLEGHGDRVARKARGLEAAVVDRQVMRIRAFEEGDARSFEVAVASPGALLIAKLHKLADRVEGDRASDKDALDVLRLLRAFDAAALARTLESLSTDAMAGEITREGVEYLDRLFGDARAPGPRMAARAVALLEPSDTIVASCVVLAGEVLAELRRRDG